MNLMVKANISDANIVDMSIPTRIPLMSERDKKLYLFDVWSSA